MLFLMVDVPTGPKMETSFPFVAISSHLEERRSKMSLRPDATAPLALDENPTFPCEEHSSKSLQLTSH